MRRLPIAALVLATTLRGADNGSPRVYLAPQGGFESYIAAAIIRKGTPIIITTNPADARYTLTTAVAEQRESGAGKIARCAFLYCIGIEGTQSATAQLISLDGDVVWAYTTSKLGAASYQSSAESIAKHLREWLTQPKGKR